MFVLVVPHGMRSLKTYHLIVVKDVGVIGC